MSLLSKVLLLTTLLSHTWNVGVWNKCLKDTHVCQCSAYKMPKHYKIIKQALCRWLKACSHQATDAGTPKTALIQPVVLRCAAPECCTHAMLPNGLMSLSTILQQYSPNVYLSQSLHCKTLAWYLQFHQGHRDSPEEQAAGSHFHINHPKIPFPVATPLSCSPWPVFSDFSGLRDLIWLPLLKGSIREYCVSIHRDTSQSSSKGRSTAQRIGHNNLPSPNMAECDKHAITWNWRGFMPDMGISDHKWLRLFSALYLLCQTYLHATPPQAGGNGQLVNLQVKKLSLLNKTPWQDVVITIKFTQISWI